MHLLTGLDLKQWLCQTLHIYRLYTHIQISTEKVFETVGLVGLMLIRLISISWNTSFVWFNDCMHWGGCSQLCSWISRTGYQQIMRYSSQNQLKPGHPLGYLVLSSLYYCFFTNAYFWGRAGLFEIICSYRLFPEPEFLCGLMWQSHWHNPSLDRYLFFSLLPSLKPVWVGIADLG